MFVTRKRFLVALVMGLSLSLTAETAEKEEAWFSADFSLGNSVGIGSFVSGSTRTPQFTTSLTLTPQVRLPLPKSWPSVFADGELSANLWWLNSYQTSAFDANNRVQFSDLSLGLSTPSIFKMADGALNFSASLPIFIPISRSSVVINRLMGAGVVLGAKWKIGQFSLSYSPGVTLWAHKGETKRLPCFDNEGRLSVMPGLVNPQNPDFDVGQYMLSLSAYQDLDASASDRCSIVGRQSVATLKNGFGAAFSFGSQKVALGLSYYWNFLRPLVENPELASIYSQSQAFTQAVMGKIAYSYNLPLPVDTTLSTGIVSYGSLFTKRGTMVFPFFDFMTPQNNQTQLFVEMTASL